MIVHSIERWELPKQKKQAKPKFVVGSEEHRQYILDRNYNFVSGNPDYQRGSTWYAKGHSKRGTIIDLLFDLNCVEWEGLKVKFIEMWFDGENISHLFHPSDLRSKK